MEVSYDTGKHKMLNVLIGFVAVIGFIALMVFFVIWSQQKEKYYWIVIRDDKVVSSGYYFYIPRVGDTVYYYLLDDFGEITPWMETGVVLSICIKASKKETNICITTKAIDQTFGEVD